LAIYYIENAAYLALVDTLQKSFLINMPTAKIAHPDATDMLLEYQYG
jgi:hypothetical protein